MLVSLANITYQGLGSLYSVSLLAFHLLRLLVLKHDNQFCAIHLSLRK